MFSVLPYLSHLSFALNWTLKPETDPPVVRVGAENITVNETQDFLLKCDYEANPASLESVKWFRNDQEIKLDSARHDGGNPENIGLIIKNSTRGDIGAYKCELANSIGKDLSDNEINVDVLCMYNRCILCSIFIS